MLARVFQHAEEVSELVGSVCSGAQYRTRCIQVQLAVTIAGKELKFRTCSNVGTAYILSTKAEALQPRISSHSQLPSSHRTPRISGTRFPEKSGQPSLAIRTGSAVGCMQALRRTRLSSTRADTRCSRSRRQLYDVTDRYPRVTIVPVPVTLGTADHAYGRWPLRQLFRRAWGSRISPERLC